MLKTLAPILALLASVALLLMGNGLQGTLLPLRAQLEAFGALQIGWLGSAYFAGFALGSLLAPRFVRRVGHIRAFTALAAIASATVLGHALAIRPDVWLPLRALTGFCLAGLYVVMESWLNAQATNATRGAILSVYTTVNLTVITLGQLLVAVLEPQTFVPFAVAAMLIALAGVPLALTTSKAPAAPEKIGVDPRWLYRISPVGLVGCFAVGLANGPFWTLAPAFARRERPRQRRGRAVYGAGGAGRRGRAMAGRAAVRPAGPPVGDPGRLPAGGRGRRGAGRGGPAPARPAALCGRGLRRLRDPALRALRGARERLRAARPVRAGLRRALTGERARRRARPVPGFALVMDARWQCVVCSPSPPPCTCCWPASCVYRTRRRAAPDAKAPFVAVPRTSTGLGTLDPRAGKG